MYAEALFQDLFRYVVWYILMMRGLWILTGFWTVNRINMNTGMDNVGKQYGFTGALILLFLLVVCLVPIQAGAKTANARPFLFGTVDFKVKLSNQSGWYKVMKRHVKDSIFYDEKLLKRSLTWKIFKSNIEKLPLLEKMGAVNKFWNAWSYRIDSEVWGREDYWATPAEFLAKSGDCEDYCIAKYFTLRELGVDIDDMRIVVVEETIRGIGHAILAVYVGKEVYILDNLYNAVRPMDKIRNYVPQFSVNENGRWMHVKAK